MGFNSQGNSKVTVTGKNTTQFGELSEMLIIFVISIFFFSGSTDFFLVCIFKIKNYLKLL